MFEFYTGDDAQAGTDARIYVTLRGINAEQTFHFDGAGGAFSVGGTDTLTRNGPAVGELGLNNLNHNSLPRA